MSPSFIHSSNPNLAIAAVGGTNYWLRAIWAIDPGLLLEPPAQPRTAANYLEAPALWVGAAAPTAAAPAIIRAEPAWWKRARESERTLWCRVEWRATPADLWIFKASVEFVINHAPDAVTVPEQVVELDPAGAIVADVRLDGSASSDPDRSAATNPAGPLGYRWAAVATPPGMAAGGPAALAAAGLAATADPLFLGAGTVVPPADRGSYQFRLTVDDKERGTVGARAGQSRTATADTRVFLGAPAAAGVSLVAPAAAKPHCGNFEDGVEVLIAYRVDPALTAQAPYAQGWRLKCTVKQALESPVAFSSPVGTQVFETTVVPATGRLEFIRWDGRDPSAAGLPSVGAFDVRLELLDAAGAATGVAGAVASAARCIVLDYARWLLPVACAPTQAVLAGGFMESGHAGFPGVGLHGGIDITRNAQPDLSAARSGFYTFLGGATNAIRIDHAAPDRTLYLHGDNREPIANGDLVLQGARLARMADVGIPGAIHLHFEHHTLEPGVVVRNPQAIVPLWDAFRPVVEAVYVRAASAAGAAASLVNANAGIGGDADLIVRCRDRSHPGRDTAVDNGPYGLTVTEKPVAVAAWPQRRFDAFVATDHLRDFYAQQGAAGAAVTQANHYLPYLRWSTAPYQRRGGPLWIDIAVADHSGLTNALRSLVLGPGASLARVPVNPAAASANPQPFTLEIDVTNETKWLNDNPADNTSFVSSDNFHIALAGAPPGWTVSPGRSGPVSNGATAAQPWGGQPQSQRLTLTIDPHGAAAPGSHAFEVVVYSAILEQVGVRVPVTAVVS